MKRIIAIAAALIVLCACGSTQKLTATTKSTYYTPYTSSTATTSKTSTVTAYTAPEPEEVDPYDIKLTDTPDSTCFCRIGYKDGTLVVVFRDKERAYCYRDVPLSVWNEFKSADSLGGYYNSYIKGQYDSERMD